MNLLQTHPQYSKAKHDWRIVRDLMQGESALKRADLAGLSRLQTYAAGLTTGSSSAIDAALGQYLPMPNPTDLSPENILRFVQYVQRAYLFNATRRTEAGMLGMVFSKPSVLILEEKLQYLATTADGSELGIEQQSAEVLSDVLQTSRDGLLVDYPQTAEATTILQQEEMGMRASIVIFKAEAIVDWACKKVGAARVLSYVKLCETTEERAADYTITTETQHRVLLLDELGNYMQRLYKSDGTFIETMPKDANSKPFKYIPFFFIGAENNKPAITAAPLIDIATINIHHYRDSADWQESSFMVGQPTPVFSGLTSQWLKDVFADGAIHIGSRAAVPLPQGGSATLLQASANQMPRQGMIDKGEQMLALGARLITSGSGAETAEAAFIKHSADASVLQVIVKNINQAYADALKAVCEFMGADVEKNAFMINQEFLASKMSADDARAAIEAWQKMAISKDVLDMNLQAGGFIPKEVELDEMNESIDANPIGIGGGFGFSG